MIGFAFLAAYPGAIAGHVRSFQLAYLIGMAGYALLIRHIWKSPTPASLTGWFVLAVAVRVPLLTMAGSDDVFRYLWEGRIQLRGHSPYTLAPDDPSLAPLRDANWSHINHPDWPTIYPPVAQIEFAALAAVHPDPRTFKAVHAFWDLVTFFLLAGWLRDRGLDPRRAVVYGLCPLAMAAFSISGHVDSLMLMFMVAACRCFDRQRFRWAGVCLGLAVAAKIMAFPLVIWFLYRNRRSGLIAVTAIVIGHLPYLPAGADLFRSLVRFGAEREFLSLIHYPLGRLLWIPPGVSKVILFAAWPAFAVWRLRRADATDRFAGPVFAALLLALPVLHYWYLAWLLVFVPFRIRISWLVLAATMVAYFEAQHQFDQSGAWFLPAWARWAMIGPFAAAALAEYGGLLVTGRPVSLTRKNR